MLNKILWRKETLLKVSNGFHRCVTVYLMLQYQIDNFVEVYTPYSFLRQLLIVMSIDFVQGQILSLASGGFMDLERCESEYGGGNYCQWRCLGMTSVVNIKETLVAEPSKEIIPPCNRLWLFNSVITSMWKKVWLTKSFDIDGAR